jgi:hypothetical protein
VGEAFYLRMLLCHEHCKGATCYQDLLTVGGERHSTYQSVCTALGLLQDDSEWDQALEDATLTQMCPQIRDLFVSILIFCAPANPLDLYTQHHHQWSDDLQHRHRTDDPDLLEAMVLLDLEERLESQNKTLSAFNLPEVSEAMRERCQQVAHAAQTSNLPRDLRYQLEHDTEALQREVDQRLHGEGCSHAGMYRPDQRTFHDTVMAAVRDPSSSQRCFFLDARGGTGKTYVENGLLAAVRLEMPESTALAVAVSGIASTLLAKASTFHSRFKAPIVGLDSATYFSVKRGTKDAEILRRCAIIIWDEAPMGHRHLLEALDRTLRDICEDGAFRLFDDLRF